MTGINGTGTANLTKIEQIGNASSAEEFLILVDQNIYGGVLWFIMIWLLWIIMFAVMQRVKDQPLPNMVTCFAVCTVLSFLLRAVNVVINGVTVGMLSDYHMWVFPLLTAICAATLWAIKDS